MDGSKQTWSVGDLAALTGLSVRTFHHYDQIGLLQPSVRTEGGHRRYLPGDVSRLAMIMVLRRARLPLSEIKSTLEAASDGSGDGLDVAGLIERQVGALEATLIDTLAFGRRLSEESLHDVARDPGRLRQLVTWIPQPASSLSRSSSWSTPTSRVRTTG